MPDNIEKMGVRAVVENLPNYQRDLKRLTGSTEKAGKEMAGTGVQSEKMGKGIAAAGLGFAAAQAAIQGVGIAARFVKSAFIDFEQGIANAGAVANATEGEMKAMTAAALEIGRSTRFSAVEATGAFEEMAAAGLSVADIMNGGAEAAAALAAAGGVALPLAADVMSTAMAVWELSTDQAAEAANRLAGAANVSRFDVEDMALAVAQGGGAAAAAGVEFGDFTTAIAAIAPSFSSGSDAGTSFKTMLVRLVPEGDKAKDALKALGLITEEGANQFFDAEGNMKSMGEIAGLLQGALGGLTEEQKLSNLQVIFGTDAMRAAAGLMKISREEFDLMSNTMRDTDAQEVAARRMDTLGGRIAFLKSTIETLAIDIGIKLAPALKLIVDNITLVIASFDALPASTKSIILIGTLAASAALILVPAIGKAITAIQSLIAWMQTAEKTARMKFAVGMGGALVALAALDFGLQKFTGHGIVDTLTGAGAAADRAAAAAERMEKAWLATEGAMTRAEFTVGGLSSAIQVLAIEEENLNDIQFDASKNALEVRDAMFEQRDAVMAAEADIRAYADELLKTTPTVLDLLEAQHQLPPEFRETFAAAVDLEGALRAQAEVFRNQLDPAIADAAFTLGVHNREAELAAAAIIAEGEAIEDTRPDWLIFIDEIEDADEATDALQKKIDTLIGRFADLNPQVIAAQTENAILTEELGDLEAKTEALTAEELIQIETIKATIEANDKLIEGYEQNQTATEETRRAIELLIGDRGYAKLEAVLAESDLSLEAQIEATKGVAQAYVNLQGPEGIGKALEGLAELKESLAGQPEVWAEIATSLGPKFAAEVAAGVTDPAVLGEINTAFNDLGLAGGEGMAAGLAAQQNLVSQFARSLAQSAIDSAAFTLEATSPSKVFINLGESIGEGLALGIDEGDSLVADALLGMFASAQRIIDNSDLPEDMRDAATEAVTGFTEQIQAGEAPTLAAIEDFFANALAEVRTGVGDLGDAAAQLFEFLDTEFEEGSDEALETAEDFLAQFMDRMVEGLEPDQYETLAADAMSALTDVIEGGGAEAVDTLRDVMIALVGTTEDAMSEIRDSAEAGIVGEAVGINLAEGIERSLPEVLAAVDLLGFSIIDQLQPISATLVGVAENAMTLMSGAFSERAQRIQDEDALGRLGANIMTSLGSALETGSDRAFERVGTFLADFLFEMEEGLDAEKAGALMGRVMEAMNLIIESGGAEGVAALRSILAEVEALIAETAAAVAAAAEAAKEGAGEGGGGPPGTGDGGGTTPPPPVVSGPSIREQSRGLIGSIEIGGQDLPYVWTSRGKKTPIHPTGTLLHSWRTDLTPDDADALRAAGIPEPPRGFHKGTPFVPETGTFLLHAGEMVLPARIAVMVRRALALEHRTAGSAFPTGVQSFAKPSSLQGDSSADLIGVAKALAGPRDLRSAEGLGGGGAGASIMFDFRGATLTGTLEENRRMMKSIAEDVIGDQVTRGAFLGGRRR